MKNKTVLSGMRPTGNLHFGNYFGALENWVSIQDKYNCHFFIADYHALTTVYSDTENLTESTYTVMADYMACGLDPEKSVIFLQSMIKEHAELHLILSMATPLSWLERCPTYKDKISGMSEKDIITYGFLGYPCLMSSDILIYNADFVPVGEDQLPHLEFTREIARRFNHLYNTKLLKEPEPLLTKAKLLPGTDGKKMSKSYNNTIAFSDTPEEAGKKIMNMVTDPQRIKKTDPGHPDICPVFAFHKVFSESEIKEIRSSCEKGEIGCVQCKRKLAEKVAVFHNPIHKKRTQLLSDKNKLKEIIIEGNSRARETAAKTLENVKKAVKIGI